MDAEDVKEDIQSHLEDDDINPNDYQPGGNPLIRGPIVFEGHVYHLSRTGSNGARSVFK